MDFTALVSSIGWQDASQGLGGTYHGYSWYVPNIIIDYIYINCPFFGARMVEDLHEDGVYYSDHYAVVTQLQV